ncbi:MerR family transcriptional regulator [Actinophytocola sp. KF-1]
MYALLKSGDVTSVRVGRLRRIPATALEKCAAQLQHAAAWTRQEMPRPPDPGQGASPERGAYPAREHQPGRPRRVPPHPVTEPCRRAFVTT